MLKVIAKTIIADQREMALYISFGGDFDDCAFKVILRDISRYPHQLSVDCLLKRKQGNVNQKIHSPLTEGNRKNLTVNISGNS